MSEETNIDNALDHQQIATVQQMTTAKSQLDEIKSAFSEDQRRVTQLIGERIGRKQMTNAFQKICNVTDLIDLQRIKETKGYKGYQVIVDGKSVIITTFEEYCTHVEGRSYESVNLELSNFKQLGEEFFDAMRQIGIGPATMRDYRKLPDDEKQALLEVAQSGDKDSFVELASTLITKHQREKEVTEKQIDTLVKTLEARSDLIKEKTDELNKKSEKINLLEAAKRQEVTEHYMPGHVQLTSLQDYTRRLTSNIEATLRSEIVKLMGEFDGGLPKPMELAIAQSFGMIIATARGVAHDMRIAPIEEVAEALDDPAKLDADAFMAHLAAQEQQDEA
ncbi:MULTISPECIES: hypothetical protein [Methylobacter]